MANEFQLALPEITSGIRQGAGLSPLLFLAYLNDHLTDITSEIRLFANYSVLY